VWSNVETGKDKDLRAQILTIINTTGPRNFSQLSI